jgi:hypothetical protein
MGGVGGEPASGNPLKGTLLCQARKAVGRQCAWLRLIGNVKDEAQKPAISAAAAQGLG